MLESSLLLSQCPEQRGSPPHLLHNNEMKGRQWQHQVVMSQCWTVHPIPRWDINMEVNIPGPQDTTTIIMTEL